MVSALLASEVMDTKTIAAVLAGLTGTTLTLACDKTPEATEVPGGHGDAHDDAADTAGEHACGNHAEGACGSDMDGGSGATQAVANDRLFQIEPGNFAEANFKMKKDSTVTVAFSKGAADLVWDIHSHDHSGGTKIHDKGTGGDGTVQFTAPEDGVFSVLWKNNGSTGTPLDVSVTLGDGAALNSWMPE